MPADFIMQAAFVLPKIAHIAQHGNRAPKRCRKYVDRSLHRERIGIVAVVNHGHISRFDQVGAAVDRSCVFNPVFDFLIGKPKLPAYSGCRERVVYVVLAWDGNAHTDCLVCKMDRQADAPKPQIFDIGGIGLFMAGGADSVKYRRFSIYLRECAQQVVVSV